jgi:hypothetical protein
LHIPRVIGGVLAELLHERDRDNTGVDLELRLVGSPRPTRTLSRAPTGEDVVDDGPLDQRDGEVSPLEVDLQQREATRRRSESGGVNAVD